MDEAHNPHTTGTATDIGAWEFNPTQGAPALSQLTLALPALGLLALVSLLVGRKLDRE